VWSLNLQLEFIWYELTSFSGYGLARLRASTNVTAATVAFQDDFEGCGTCDESNRIRFAQAVLRAYGSTPVTPPKPTPTPAKPTSCGAIKPGHGIVRGESVSSCGGKYSLAMQTDGNLVLYEKGKATALWSTGTNGSDGFAAIMQGDGNFVLYGKTSDPLWSSRSNGHNGADLAVQTDGNLVVYAGSNAVWNSGTEGR